MKEVTVTGDAKTKQEIHIKTEFNSRQLTMNDQVSKDFGVDMSKPKMVRTKLIGTIAVTTGKPTFFMPPTEKPMHPTYHYRMVLI